MELIVVRPLSAATNIDRLVEMCASAAEHTNFRFIILRAEDRIDFETKDITLNVARMLKPLIDEIVELSE